MCALLNCANYENSIIGWFGSHLIDKPPSPNFYPYFDTQRARKSNVVQTFFREGQVLLSFAASLSKFQSDRNVFPGKC